MRLCFFVRYVCSLELDVVFSSSNLDQDSSGMINGADIRVDGGFTIR